MPGALKVSWQGVKRAGFIFEGPWTSNVVALR